MTQVYLPRENMSARTILIDSAEKLREMRKELVNESTLAIDTEFHSERRYFPELMLVQIANSAGDVWIVDPKTVPMKALGEALRTAVLITHGGQQDIRIFHQDLQLRPSKLFDTQIAAGFLGHRYPLNLQVLCDKILGLDISKVETLTDWSKRPLSENQIRYAADDARVLFPLYTELMKQIEERDVAEHMWKACAEMVEQQLLPPSSGLSWIHWGVAETLNIDAQRVLTNLLEWREETAVRQNQSANYILPRSILLYLAKAQPQSVKEIQNRRVHPTFLKRYGKKVIKVIKDGLHDTDEFLLPTPEQKERTEVLKLWVNIFAKEVCIAPTLLLPKDILEGITLHGVSILQSWRRELMLQRLKAFLRGQEFIVIEHGKAVLRQGTSKA